MKTAAAATAVILAATLAAAEPQHAMPSGTKINCSKPNATYCMGGDIILRCDANAVGTPGRCSDNVSGYPPPGGIAQCWQSSRDAGDAACQKNCVVYADKPFTLSADQCTPSATQTGPPTSTGGSTTSITSSTGGSSSTSSTGSSTSGSSSATSTSTESSSVTTTLSPPPGTAITPTHTGGNSTVTTPVITRTSSGSVTAPPTGDSTITLTSTSGSKPTTTPANSNNAAGNSAMGGLFALGLAVAALF